MENKFEWTDALVKEYAGTAINGTIQDIEYFKKSKANTPVSKGAKINTIKYIGESFITEYFKGPFYKVYEFLSTEIISHHKYPEIKQSIERVLNDEFNIYGLQLKDLQATWNDILDCLNKLGLANYKWEYPISQCNRVINFLKEKINPEQPSISSVEDKDLKILKLERDNKALQSINGQLCEHIDCLNEKETGKSDWEILHYIDEKHTVHSERTYRDGYRIYSVRIGKDTFTLGAKTNWGAITKIEKTDKHSFDFVFYTDNGHFPHFAHELTILKW